ncbi:hypothetical protein R3W88_020244 [Solanum pinnatisectum]|uniref:Tryptophan decarboxylase n=1 Tax=Solanum pinnatisectum TaxID=50273 RepID=A0AAV9KLR1_9SOLN|nr:hypothetical protein R3W88_020244 [Solanum pinnatisectum]
MGTLNSNNNAQILPKFNPLDPEQFRNQAHQMTYPVLSQVEPGYLRTQLPQNAPNRPESFESIMKDVQNHIVPGMTHWLSPNFFAFFPATVSSAAFLGEMLCNCFNSVGFNWLAELEMIVMDWLANMLKLPKTFMFSGTGGGVLQITTSEAILCTLIAARDRKIENLGLDYIRKFVIYGSDQTHSMYTKACKVAGIFPCNIRAVPTSIESDFALSPAEFDIWFHVDAAYGGSAGKCPEFRQYLYGIERANSLSLSPHKWLLSYLDCCCMWVREPNVLVKALSTNPEYLRNKRSEYDSVFKSLRLWFVMRSYGVANLQSHIRSDVLFDAVVPRCFSLVCFRFSPNKEHELGYTEFLNKKLLDSVNSTGRIYMTHNIGATFTEDRHVISTWKLIKETTNALLRESVF